jgi:hypothetical protein
MAGLRFLFYSSLILGCQSLSDFACSSTLRKSLFQPPVLLPVPLLGAEVDVLMQRRNTKVGNIYSTHDELYNDRLAKSVYCGRNDVEAAIKAIQRFTLQRKLFIYSLFLIIYKFFIFVGVMIASHALSSFLQIADAKLTGATVALIWN